MIMVYLKYAFNVLVVYYSTCIFGESGWIRPDQGSLLEGNAVEVSEADAINSLTCGQATAAGSRVIGGKDASAGEWPWQAKLVTEGLGFTCGGSLITRDWVMTAAHCISSNDPSIYRVTLGDVDREKRDGTEQTFNVKRVVVHPKYNWPVPINNDIALLQLIRPATITSFVNTICLPRDSEVVRAGTKCYISGWGQMNHPGSASIVLQQAAMHVVSNRECQTKHMNSAINSSSAVTSKMLCAGDSGKTIKSGCFGDSGGPFVCQNPAEQWIQQGIVSWGDPACSSANHHSVFARVSAFRRWIEKVINA